MEESGRGAASIVGKCSLSLCGDSTEGERMKEREREDEREREKEKEASRVHAITVESN